MRIISKNIEKLQGFILEKELHSLYLLAPILMGFGIILYFKLPAEPNFIASVSIFLFSAIATYICYKFKKFFLISLFISLFALGFLSANFRAINSSSPIFSDESKPVWVRADIEKIETQGKFFKLTLKNVDLWRPEVKNFPPNQTPKRIKVTVRTKFDANIKVADRVAFRAILQAPAQKALFPDGYDFNKVAYFQKIGAIGFAISEVKLFQQKQPNWIDKFQDYIYKKITENIPDKDISGIVTAQITAERGEISDETKQSLKNSGLGHLIAISGLNMSVAMVWVFFLARLLFSFSARISLKYDTKKLSVFIAAILGFLYLLITGMPVSAVRAFLMVLLFLIAVLFDKFSISLHPVAVAAFIVMLIMPEQILFPSFQLSFAAVIGLIGLYEFYEQKFKKNKTKDSGFIKRQLLAFIAIIGTTLFTSITTAPFGILHFGAFQNFGIVSNMIGVPAVSILVLPFSFLAILFMPLGLEKPFLWVAEQGAIIIKKTSEYVSSLPNSVTYFADIPNNFITFVVIGFFIFFIFKSKFRYIGIPILLAGYLLIFKPAPQPDFVINETGSLIALKQEGGGYKYFGINRPSFAQYQFNSKLGVEKPEFIKPDKNCNRKRCIYKNILFGNFFTPQDCKSFKYIINLGKYNLFCNMISGEAKVIDKLTLRQKGTHLFYLSSNPSDIKIITTSDEIKQRVWNRY